MKKLAGLAMHQQYECNTYFWNNSSFIYWSNNKKCGSLTWCMCGLTYFYKLCRLSDEWWSFRPHIALKVSSSLIFGFNHSNGWKTWLYKHDVTKGITIHSAFFAKNGHSSLSEIQINLSDFLNWTIFFGKYCITGKLNIVLFWLFSKGRCCKLDNRISNQFPAW